MMTIMRLPNAVVRRKHAVSNDFIVTGACEYENSKPVIENMISAAVMMMYCGINHNICTLFGSVTMMVLKLDVPCCNHKFNIDVTLLEIH